MLINQSNNQSINQSYSAGLFYTSVINLSLSKILKSRSMMFAICLEGQTKTGGRAVVLPLVHASRYVLLCYFHLKQNVSSQQ